MSDDWAPHGGVVAFVREKLAEGWSEDRIEAELRRRRRPLQAVPPSRPAVRDYHDVDSGRDADEDQET